VANIIHVNKTVQKKIAAKIPLEDEASVIQVKLSIVPISTFVLDVLRMSGTLRDGCSKLGYTTANWDMEGSKSFKFLI